MQVKSRTPKKGKHGDGVTYRAKDAGGGGLKIVSLELFCLECFAYHSP